jgi:hypothetical protein
MAKVTITCRFENSHGQRSFARPVASQALSAALISGFDCSPPSHLGRAFTREFLEHEKRQLGFSSQIAGLSYNWVMPRPTLLVAESESVDALSVRKLVLETGKFNVLTAHSFDEALDLFHLFPGISAAVIVMDAKIDGENLARTIKSTGQKIPVIALEQLIGGRCPFADHHVPSDDSQALLELARSLLGDPRQLDSIRAVS